MGMGLVRFGALAHTSPDAISAYLRDAEAPALVRAIRDSDDTELQAVLEDGECAAAVLDGLLARFADLAIPAQLAQASGTIRWEAGPQLLRVFRIERGTVETLHKGPADIVIRGSLTDLLRLVAGQLDVSLRYLAGDFEIEGDAGLALAVAALFAVDGTDPVLGHPVDPRAIDPVEVAGVLRGVSTDHLRSVMASGFRPVILEEIFGRMPAFVNSRKAAGVRVTVGFRLTGRPDGEVDRYVLRLDDGQATVLAGEAADAVGRGDRDATVTCEAHDFLRLVTGHLGAVSGVLKGQLKVRGAAALRLNSAFDIPTAVAG
jgi:putative sterol carrier protein